jgi:hypothetical protein
MNQGWFIESLLQYINCAILNKIYNNLQFIATIIIPVSCSHVRPKWNVKLSDLSSFSYYLSILKFPLLGEC